MASVCVLCCQIYRDDGAEAEPRVDKLSEALRGAQGLSTEEVNERAGKLEKLVCAVCAASIETAIVQKEDIVATERKVRQLQTLLLRTLGHLEISVGEYQRQMKEVDMIMKDSHSNINSIDTYFSELGRKAELKGAIDLRTDMFSVVRALRDFEKSLETPKAAAAEETVESHVPPPNEAPEVGSAEEGSVEQIPGPSNNDGGQLEVAFPRPVPVTRPCSVVLPRLAVPRAARKARGPSTCAKCGRRCKNNLGLRRHRCHVCPVCKLRLPAQNRLVHHIRMKHPTEKPLKCRYCGKRFIFQWEVDSHVATHHDASKKRWICRDCTPHRAFASKSRLTVHQAARRCVKEVPTGVKMPYSCQRCGKGFNSRHRLEWHVASRHDYSKKKYVCEDCDPVLAFAYPSVLRVHRIREHSKRVD